MNKRIRISHAVLLLVMSISLAACGGQAPVEPTVDLSMVKTDAVSTVIAQMTADAPRITATSQPTSTTAIINTATLPALATAAPAVVLPTATKTRIIYSGGAAAPTVNTYVDQGQLVYQNPTDGTVLAPGQDFDAIWTIKNIGRRDWNDQFYFKYLTGTPEGVLFDHDMLPKVARGDSVTVTVDMIAPQEPGTYTSQWGLVNDDAIVFFKFFITIVVK
ncbi:MAG: NBR1-Ig-like domain-containing protein [Anaerolineaceae bacterium]